MRRPYEEDSAPEIANTPSSTAARCKAAIDLASSITPLRTISRARASGTRLTVST